MHSGQSYFCGKLFAGLFSAPTIEIKFPKHLLVVNIAAISTVFIRLTAHLE